MYEIAMRQKRFLMKASSVFLYGGENERKYGGAPCIEKEGQKVTPTQSGAEG